MLKLVKGDGDGVPSVQHCIAAGLLAQVEKGKVRAVSVVIVDDEGGVGHMYWVGNDWAGLCAGSHAMAQRVTAHGTVEPRDGEWCPSNIPEGMRDPFLPCDGEE